MWSLWFFPLVILSAAVGAVFGLVWFFRNRDLGAKRYALAPIFPVGCFALPMVLLGVVSSCSKLMSKSDSDYFEEIFGYSPEISEQRMLTDDFGSGNEYAIFMRLEPNATERTRLLDIPGLKESSLPVHSVRSFGQNLGLGWWLPEGDGALGRCELLRISEANGFRRWQLFVVAECVKDPSDAVGTASTRDVYVIASRRGL